MPRPLRKGLDLNNQGAQGKAAALLFLRAAQQPPHSQETPHFPRTRSAFWQQPADLSRPASRAPGSTWVGPKAPTEMTLVAPSRMMWQNAKKGGGGGGKSRRLGKVMRQKSSPFDASIYCSVAAVSDSLGALRPEFLRTAAPRHSVEGYIRRRGGEVTGAEFCCRDPSAGLSRFRSLRCARFRHCGSPGPWSLRPRPELFRLPASFLRPRRLSC